MDAEVVKKPGSPGRKRLPKLLIFAVTIIVLGALAAVFIFKGNVFSKKAAVVQRTATAVKGNLSVKVTGSGSVESSNRADITPSVSGVLSKVYFKEGDSVKKGDLLFEINDTSARLNVAKIENSIAQARLTAGNDSKNLDNLVIKAPFSGRITNINVKTADEPGKGAALMTITNTSQMKVTIPFSSAASGKLSQGQKAEINLQSLMQTIEGKVSSISGYSYISENGGDVFDVEITINNPGSLKESMIVSAEIGTYTGSATGKLAYADSQVLKSSTGGIVKSLNVKENQAVASGTTLLVLQNDELEISSQASVLKIEDLNAQLEAAEEQLAAYKIYSQIDGIIVSQDVAAGDSVKSGNTLATISDPDHMQFSIDIDELDIDKIKAGQKVNITIDALTETAKTPLAGVVSGVALEGTSSNGVTTYPVTIAFDDARNLKAGMNANAEIIINEKTEVLLVPLEAVQKMGNNSFVMVKGSGNGDKSQINGFNPGDAAGMNREGNNNSGRTRNRGTANNSSSSDSSNNSGNTSGNMAENSSGNMRSRSAGNFAQRNTASSAYYANAVMTRVELGLNNDEYVEIVSGLNEGDVVILPQLTASTSNAVQSGAGMGALGGMGGFNMGGMPNAGQRNNNFNNGSRNNSSRNNSNSSPNN